MTHRSNRRKFDQIQAFTQKALRGSKKEKRPLSVLAKDNCSEISRLVGCFILRLKNEDSVFILKGKNVRRTKRAHDILAMQNADTVYMLDPSVWQFFPRKRSILIGSATDLSGAVQLAKDRYGGTWKLSERLTLSHCAKEEKEWLSVIAENNKTHSR